MKTDSFTSTSLKLSNIELVSHHPNAKSPGKFARWGRELPKLIITNLNAERHSEVPMVLKILKSLSEEIIHPFF